VKKKLIQAAEEDEEDEDEYDEEDDYDEEDYGEETAKQPPKLIEGKLYPYMDTVSALLTSL
jgi:hypothetical protein